MELEEGKEPESHAKAVPTPDPSSWGFILLLGLFQPPGTEGFAIQLWERQKSPEKREEAKGQ